ncbi:hypothetical protein [Streptomyces sp. NPDC001985]|uniref:hypothetical protein n=1 Tax=Streptomyces sp. NPDC001985 TaxID=3154406 RepID=UPI003324A17A
MPTTGDDGYGDDDRALMAVLLGEPAPEGPGAGAAYRRAARDMDTLAGQLRVLGHELSWDPGHHPVPPPEPPARRRGRAVLALVASVAVLAGLAAAWLSPGPGAAGPEAESKPVVCSRLIAEGTVARTEPDGDRLRVVLAVDRYLVPGHGPRERAFTVERAEAARYADGSRLLVHLFRVRGGREEEVAVYRGAEIDRVEELLPVPAGPGDGDGRCGTPE